VPESLSIALVLPHAWPPREDVGWHVQGAATALAARGHAVTVLAPTLDRDLLVAGRDALKDLAAGHPAAVLATPGTVRFIAIGRALPAGAGRRLPGPIDTASNLETALSLVPFDVVHIHEPLAASPALGALRHARGVTAATFHGHEQLAGVAFLQPLVDRALARVDVCIATTEMARRALTDLLPRDYVLIPGGVDPDRFQAPAREPVGPPGVVVIARGRDRSGLRFAMRALRRVDVPAVGRISVIGPPDAPWRTRAAIPKALRSFAVVIPDTGPESRADAFARARIAVVATPDDVADTAISEAMACGMAVVAPSCDELDRVLTHGHEGLALPAFAAPAWGEAVDTLAVNAARRRELGEQAAARAGSRHWGVVASEIEAQYRSAIAHRTGAPAVTSAATFADMHVRLGPELDVATLIATCRDRGVGVVGVVGGPRAGVGPARDAAMLAPPDLRVVVGQEIATEEGVIIGLNLVRDVPDGLPLAAAAAAVHAQGGIVMVPHPSSDPPPPTAETLRRHSQSIDCAEFVTGTAPSGIRGAEFARRFGVVAIAASGASRPDDVGIVGMHIGPFATGADLAAALGAGDLARRRRPILTRPHPAERAPRRRAARRDATEASRNREEQGK
jgi:glycosyltransferase involved in cell wall biosynthesis